MHLAATAIRNEMGHDVIIVVPRRATAGSVHFEHHF